MLAISESIAIDQQFRQENIPAYLLTSYLRLFDAARQHDYRHTDPLNFTEQLIPLLGVQQTQAYRHLALLRKAGWLNWYCVLKQGYVFTFPRADRQVTGGDFPPTAANRSTTQANFPGSSRAIVIQPFGPTVSWSVYPARREDISGLLADFSGIQEDFSDALPNLPEIAAFHPDSPGAPQDVIIDPPEKPIVPVESSFAQPEADYAQPEENYTRPESPSARPEANYALPQSGSDQPEADYDQPEANYVQPQADPDFADSHTDFPESGRIFPPRARGLNDSDGGGGESFNPKLKIKDSPPPPPRIKTRVLRQEEAQVQHFLLRAGIPDQNANELIAQILANEQQPEHPHRVTRADVLGWIVLTHAYRAENNIANPGALMHAHLLRNRRCPTCFRPQPLCRVCHMTVDHCTCNAPPEPYFPDDFLEFAFERRYDVLHQDLWRVCLSCHGYPCQCPAEKITAEAA